MILKYQELLDIKSGKITLAFRRWRRPSVKEGGSLRTALGVIRIVSLTKIKEDSITNAEAKKAGFPNRETVLALLSRFKEGTLYRIAFKYESEDPRIDLREQTSLSDPEFMKLRKRLDRLDAGKSGPWTLKYLRLIGKYPERRAGDLADMMEMDKMDFKLNVRKLKDLGLTISHEIGYSVSPLGHWVMENWKGGGHNSSSL